MYASEIGRPRSVKKNNCLFVNGLRRKESSGANARPGFGSSFRAEVSVKRVDGRVQNQMAVGARCQMPLDLAFDRRGESTL